MPQPSSVQKGAKAVDQAVTKETYLMLASFLEGNVRNPFARKKNPQGEALREAGELYQRLQYVAAYECLKPAHEKVVADMQRILARNLDFEANKLVKEQQKPLAAAKETVQKLKAYAQQVIDQFDSLLQDLESKSLVRVHLLKRLSQNRNAPSPSPSPADGGGGFGAVAAPPAEEPPGATASFAQQREAGSRVPLQSKSAVAPGEAPLDANVLSSHEIVSGNRRYRKAPYAPPDKGALYSVRDKSGRERVIRAIGKSPDGTLVQVETVEDGKPSQRPIQVAVDSLARQAAKGWCSLLLPFAESEEAPAASQPAVSNTAADVAMRLDIQNFGRCCADIARANIKFDTQLIKDVGDGPFRAGNYEQAFLTFEQCAMGFTSAVASSRQVIADGRRALTAEKGKLSGKEIEERKAAFVRSEQLINTAQREFSTILEGLRMYLRAQQG